ncbi:hypothetical protein M0802_007145 [Mischocyttarus mexicanus]|nr:hypothetical protein M0802_007145 [Mischocyttarus mexicanus]
MAAKCSQKERKSYEGKGVGRVGDVQKEDKEPLGDFSNARVTRQTGGQNLLVGVRVFDGAESRNNQEF